MKKKEMKMPKRNRASVGLLAALALLCLMGCNASPKASEVGGSETIADAQEEVAAPSVEDVKDVFMAAPKIETDGEGLIALGQCPQTDKHLKVVLADDNTKAEIYYDGKLLQTVEDQEGALVAAGGDIPVRFMDANFDGLTDIFIGPGESRTYSTLLVWNSASEKFERIGTLGEPSLQGFMLEPGTKSVYEGGSASYCLFVVTRSAWDGGELKTKEKLFCVSDPSQYAANDVSDKFSLRDDNDGEEMATRLANELPGNWKNVVAIYGLE